MGDYDPLGLFFLPGGIFFFTLFFILFGVPLGIGGGIVGVLVSFRRRDRISGYLRRAALGVVGGFALGCTIFIANSLLHQFLILIQHDGCNAEQFVFSDKEFLAPISTIIYRTRPLTCLSAAVLVLMYYLPFVFAGLLTAWSYSRRLSESPSRFFRRSAIGIAIWLVVGSTVMLFLIYIDGSHLLFQVIAPRVPAALSGVW